MKIKGGAVLLESPIKGRCLCRLGLCDASGGCAVWRAKGSDGPCAVWRAKGGDGPCAVPHGANGFHPRNDGKRVSDPRVDCVPPISVEPTLGPITRCAPKRPSTETRLPKPCPAWLGSCCCCRPLVWRWVPWALSVALAGESRRRATGPEGVTAPCPLKCVLFGPTNDANNDAVDPNGSGPSPAVDLSGLGPVKS